MLLSHNRIPTTLIINAFIFSVINQNTRIIHTCTNDITDTYCICSDHVRNLKYIPWFNFYHVMRDCLQYKLRVTKLKTRMLQWAAAIPSHCCPSTWTRKYEKKASSTCRRYRNIWTWPNYVNCWANTARLADCFCSQLLTVILITIEKCCVLTVFFFFYSKFEKETGQTFHRGLGWIWTEKGGQASCRAIEWQEYRFPKA